MLSCLKAVEGGVQLAVQVQPRASRLEVVAVRDDVLRIRLTSPPVEGAANKLCREYLAKLFGLPKSGVTLLAGERARQKRWFLADLNLEEADRLLRQALGAEGKGER